MKKIISFILMITIIVSIINIIPTYATDSIVEKPIFITTISNFTTSIIIKFASRTDGAKIYYTLDGDEPDENDLLYDDGVRIYDTTTIKAIAILDGVSSIIVQKTYTKITAGGNEHAMQSQIMSILNIDNVYSIDITLLNLTNNDITNTKCAIILYDDINKVIGAKVHGVDNISSLASETLYINLTTNTIPYKVKVFVLDSIENICPLSESSEKII